MKLRLVLTIVIAFFIVSAPLSAVATVEVSTAFQGFAEEPFFICVYYEDVSVIGHVLSALEQNLEALEYIVSRLKIEGKLDMDFPGVIINARKQYEVDNRFETMETTLSFTNSATFVCTNPDVRKFEPVKLGPSYLIETTTGLLSFEDLLALIIRLRELNGETPKITIASEEDLSIGKVNPDFERFKNIQIQYGMPYTSSGNLSLLPVWDAQILRYSLIDPKGNTIEELVPADIYIGHLAWPSTERMDLSGRFIAYASTEKAIVYDAAKDVYHTLDFDFAFQDEYAQREFEWFGRVQRVEFAVHKSEDIIYVFPFGRGLSLTVIYSLDLNSGVWLREYEEWTLYEKVWSNRDAGVWLPLPRATLDQRTINTGFEFVAWQDGQPYPDFMKTVNEILVESPQEEPQEKMTEDQLPEVIPVSEEPLGETESSFIYLWLLLPALASAVTYLLIRKW